MPRIRTVKPEFWTSEDIAALSLPTRLVFIGLWGYVDDNGVGVANERLITSALFPMDDHRESLANVREALDALSNGGQIVRYEVDGRQLLAVTKWEHQKIDHPGKERLPRPADLPLIRQDPELRAKFAKPSRAFARDSRLYQGSGIREQGSGSEGSGTRGARPTPTAAPPAVVDAEPVPADVEVPDPGTAATILAEYVDACRQRPPKKTLAALARDIAALLAEGFDPDDVRAGIRDMAGKGYSAGLPQFVNGIVNRPATVRHSADANTQGWGDLTAQLAATGTDAALPALRALPGGAL